MPRRRIAKGAARSRAQIAAQQKAAEASARKRRKRGGDEPSARRAVARLDTNAPNNKKDIVALKEATKGGTARGKVSLAASAKVGRENVINDADRIAYRAAAAESRKLKVTLGDNAPTPDKIFSTAKKIAKIRAGDDEVKKPDIVKAAKSLDPDEKTPDVAKKVPLSERTLIVPDAKKTKRQLINEFNDPGTSESRKKAINDEFARRNNPKPRIEMSASERKQLEALDAEEAKRNSSSKAVVSKKNQSAQEKMTDPENVARVNARVAASAKKKAEGDAHRSKIARGEAQPRKLTKASNEGGAKKPRTVGDILKDIKAAEADVRNARKVSSADNNRAQITGDSRGTGASGLGDAKKRLSDLEAELETAKANVAKRAQAKKADLPDGKIAPPGGDTSGPTRVQVNGFVLSRSGAATFRQDVKQANGDPEKIRSKAKDRNGELRKALEAEADALGGENSSGNDTPDGDADGTNDNRPNGFNSSSMDAAIRGVAKVKQTDRYVRTSDAELADKIYEVKELLEKARLKLGTSNLSDMAFTAYRETLEDLVAELRVRKSGRGKAATGVKQPPLGRRGRPER